ncbi:MAG: FAD-binding protein, partial [Deltaproteobacteria bacterium]|nr:FAD-binding protein [Deltaproteobacteria bacterium]
LSRCGKASWVGVLRDPLGAPIGPFVTKPDKKHGDAISDIYPTMFRDYEREAKGPVYMDCGGITDEDYQYMLHFMKHEGLSSLINYLEEEGIDLRKNQVEFGTYEIIPRGGIYHDDKGETAVKGLFTAGDEAYSGSSISMASTTGWLIGESAANYARSVDTPDIDRMTSVIVNELKVREDGPDWKEVNIAVQQIMYDYAGEKRTETLLEAGLRHLRRLKEKTYHTMIARNQHELLHCLEVLNLIDVGEVLLIAANERKESRGIHIRPDYPYTNPVLDKFLVVRNVNGKPVIEWEEVRR